MNIYRNTVYIIIITEKNAIVKNNIEKNYSFEYFFAALYSSIISSLEKALPSL